MPVALIRASSASRSWVSTAAIRWRRSSTPNVSMCRLSQILVRGSNPEVGGLGSPNGIRTRAATLRES